MMMMMIKYHIQSLELVMKKEDISRRVGGMPPLQKILKVEVKLCNLRNSGGQFEEIYHTKIHDEYQFCTFNLHSQTHQLNFHRKKVCLSIIFHRKFFPRDFLFSFPRESSFPRRIPSSAHCHQIQCETS